MPQSRKPHFRLNLGDMDLRARITFATNPYDTPMLEDLRAAAVKRYQGNLHASIQCGFRPVLARVSHRTLNILNGNQSQPSLRTRRLLNALPRLETGQPQLEQRHEDSVPDYFSLFGGWERWAQPPPSISIPNPFATFDYYNYIRADVHYMAKALVRYHTVTMRNRRHATEQHDVERYAREAREGIFWLSLVSEKAEFERLVATMDANGAGYGVVMPPRWAEWRYWTTVQAVERAHWERARRAEWAMCFEDTRLLV